MTGRTHHHSDILRYSSSIQVQGETAPAVIFQGFGCVVGPVHGKVFQLQAQTPDLQEGVTQVQVHNEQLLLQQFLKQNSTGPGSQPKSLNVSCTVFAIYQDRLAAPDPQGQGAVVFFFGGGGGSVPGIREMHMSMCRSTKSCWSKRHQHKVFGPMTCRHARRLLHLADVCHFCRTTPTPRRTQPLALSFGVRLKRWV